MSSPVSFPMNFSVNALMGSPFPAPVKHSPSTHSSVSPSVNTDGSARVVGQSDLLDVSLSHRPMPTFGRITIEVDGEGMPTAIALKTPGDTGGVYVGEVKLPREKGIRGQTPLDAEFNYQLKSYSSSQEQREQAFLSVMKNYLRTYLDPEGEEGEIQNLPGFDTAVQLGWVNAKGYVQDKWAAFEAALADLPLTISDAYAQKYPAMGQD